jgi:hypothetical protein
MSGIISLLHAHKHKRQSQVSCQISQLDEFRSRPAARIAASEKIEMIGDISNTAGQREGTLQNDEC